MKKFETVTETRTIEKLVDIVCDVCGRSEKDWEVKGGTEDYLENEVQLEHVIIDGGYYSEVEKLALDICVPCFGQKILPHIKEISANPDSEAFKYKDNYS